KKGIYNRYVAKYDSAIAFVDTTEHYRYFFNSKPGTNFDRAIVSQQINTGGTHVADLIYANGRDMMLLTPLERLDEVNIPEPANTWHRSFIGPAINDPASYREPGGMLTPQRPSENNKGIDFENYRFENEKDR